METTIRIFCLQTTPSVRFHSLQTENSYGCLHDMLCSHSFDQRICEQQNQSDDQSVDSQRLHECQRKQQHTAKIICNFWLAADAIDAAARGNSLPNSGTDSRQTNGETG